MLNFIECFQACSLVTNAKWWVEICNFIHFMSWPCYIAAVNVQHLSTLYIPLYCILYHNNYSCYISLTSIYRPRVGTCYIIRKKCCYWEMNPCWCQMFMLIYPYTHCSQCLLYLSIYIIMSSMKWPFTALPLPMGAFWGQLRITAWELLW